MKASVFDDRRNELGEGPTSSGPKNQHIMWVDIPGKKVRSRDMATGHVAEYDTLEDVGFAIPRVGGGEIIGTANGPVLRDVDGTLHGLPTRELADGYRDRNLIRWNDAKVSPSGELFLGSMAYEFTTNASALYQMRSDGKHIRRLFGDVTISNGLDWTPDGQTMFYIDTPLRRVDIFDVDQRDIKNRRTLVHFPESMGSPDGMCADANGNIWVAFWLGAAVRCFDGITGAQLAEISCPAPRITSCAFAGEDLDQLIITSASQETDLGKYPEAGFVFIASPGVTGQKTTLFGA